MRSVFLQLFILPVVFHVLARASPMLPIRDSIRIPQVTGSLTLTNIGFAPIPAFSFNGPLITALLSLKKGRFRYEPDFAGGLNGKLWMANNWFRYSILEQKKWKLNTAFNPFLFFENIQVGPEDQIIRVQRNISFEVSWEFKPTFRSTLNLAYRYNKGNDGGLSGHLIDLSSNLTIPSGFARTSLTFRPQLFYFDFTGSTNGLFTSAGLFMSKQGWPFSLQVQAVRLLKADFPADPFSWNIGLAYTL